MGLVRCRQPELMDQPGLSVGTHRQALRGLRRINWFSRTDAVLWRAIQKFFVRTPPAPLRILDVACGGGDIAVRLARRAQQEGLPVHITGIDVSATAVSAARELADVSGCNHVQFEHRNIFQDSLSSSYDIVLSTLFLHHLEEFQALELLTRMRSAATLAVLVDDLRPTQWGYWMAVGACRLLTRSAVVHFDGPVSVQAAYTPAEARALAERAGMVGATVRCHWPQRYLLAWSRA